MISRILFILVLVLYVPSQLLGKCHDGEARIDNIWAMHVQCRYQLYLLDLQFIHTWLKNMDFTSNVTSDNLLSGVDLASNDFQSPRTIGLASVIATFFSFLAYLSYSPRIDKKAPAFTTDTVPFVGSWRFFTQKL